MYCFFQALEGFLQIQSSEAKAQTLGMLLFPHISGLFALQPYAHTTQKQYNVNTLHSGNLYQIFTYVKNLDKENTGNVSGMLLYAKTDEMVLPNNSYKMGGNAISVKTLNLDCDFLEIRKQLDDIAIQHFDLENA